MTHIMSWKTKPKGQTPVLELYSRISRVSRNAKSQSVDHNLAWPDAGWSTTINSPDVDYTHVEMKMEAYPEEEIYSK